MPRLRLSNLPVFAILIASLLGCKPAGNAQNLSFGSFVAQRYGATATDSTSWTDSLGEKYAACLRSEVRVKSEPHLLLAICSESSERNHATEGLVDLFVLRGTWDDFVVAAETTGIRSGSNGSPGTVSALHLGADFYGFEVRGGYLGEGQLIESITWFAPGKTSGIRPVFDATCLDDARETGACLEDSLACTMERRLLSIDSSRRELKTFPVVIEDSLLKDGVVRHRKNRMEFDKKTWSYPKEPMLSEVSQ